VRRGLGVLLGTSIAALLGSLVGISLPIFWRGLTKLSIAFKTATGNRRDPDAMKLFPSFASVDSIIFGNSGSSDGQGIEGPAPASEVRSAP